MPPGSIHLSSQNSGRWGKWIPDWGQLHLHSKFQASQSTERPCIKRKNTTIGSTSTSTKNRIPQHFSLTRKMGGWQGEEQCSGCPQLHTPVILALQRLRQEDSCEFKARLDYTGYQDSPLYRIRAAINPPWFWAACGGSPVFPAFDIVKENCTEFEASLGHTVRPCVLRKKRHPCSFIMWL